MPSTARKQRSEKSGLAVLRARIRAAKIPAAREGNLRLATWNIRELGKGERLPESLRMIAEILRCFDLVSVVELRDDVRDLMRIMRMLGKHWSVVFSDYIRDPGGNRERLAFAFDTRRVTFTGLAGNAEGPRRRVGDRYERVLHWWRPPFMASFQAGSFDFIVIAAHVRWGRSTEARLAELDAILMWLRARRSERHFGDRDVIAVGDFNVLGPGTATFDVVERRGFALPSGLESIRSAGVARLATGKRYDHILCTRDQVATFSTRGGIVDFYCGDHRTLFPMKAITKAKFTRQLSDHLPLWAELVTAASRADRWTG